MRRSEKKENFLYALITAWTFIRLRWCRLAGSALLLLRVEAPAQMVIGNTIDLAASATDIPVITLHTSAGLDNRNSFDFGKTDLSMTLDGSGDQSLSGNWTIAALRIDGGSQKNMDGKITVTYRLNFCNGVVIPSPRAKFLFTGPEDGIQGGSERSFVEGPFFQMGTGSRSFPLGIRTADAPVFAPLVLTDIDLVLEAGVELNNEDPRLQRSPRTLSIEPRYWKLLIHNEADIARLDTRVSVSTAGFDYTTEDQFVVLQGKNTGEPAEHLGTLAWENDMVTSEEKLTRPIVAIGRMEDVGLVIYNVITPSPNASGNTSLYIKCLDKFPENKVTLLDRWGVIIKAWDNYNNDHPGYDFNDLPAGHYICVVEYQDNTGRKRKTSRMVTVLKSR